MKTPWDFYKSIFKTYKIDNQSLIDELFEIDWANTKCEKILNRFKPCFINSPKNCYVFNQLLIAKDSIKAGRGVMAQVGNQASLKEQKNI